MSRWPPAGVGASYWGDAAYAGQTHGRAYYMAAAAAAAAAAPHHGVLQEQVGR